MTSFADPLVSAPPSLAGLSEGRTRSGAVRMDGIDILRGLIICLMALDHVRDFVHPSGQFDPLNLDLTNPALFATRWITHFCAPTFVLLAGVSAWLQGRNGKSPAALSRFLLTRGVWLIVLELTVVGFGWQFTPVLVFLQVIWAIGWSMVLLSLLTRLPSRLVLLVGVVIIAGHNLLDPIAPQSFGAWAPLWNAIHVSGLAPVLGVPVLFAYPVLPWFGVMCLGFGLGPIFVEPVERRRLILIIVGASMIVGFVLLRMVRIYGDPLPWAVHPEVWKTVGDFVDVQKYPPSLLYVLMTLGPALVALPLLERLKGPVARIFLAFGRAPLFAYVLHIYVAHLLTMAIGVALGYPASAFLNSLFQGPPDGWGLSLAATYGVWILVLIILYPPVRWFAGVKARRRDWWLGYL